jgi:hypothetical protein
MKTINRSLFGLAILMFAGLLTISCKKDTEGISKVEEHPVLTLNGESFVNLLTGVPYVEQGAVATYKGQPLDVTIVGSVNVNAPGVYFVTYSTENVTDVTIRKEVTRAILISDEYIVAGQYVGNYRIVSTTRTNQPTIAQISPGIYRISDGNFQATPIPVEFLDLGGGRFMVYPEVQSAGQFGNYTGTVTYDPAGANGPTFTFTLNLFQIGATTTASFYKVE